MDCSRVRTVNCSGLRQYYLEGLVCEVVWRSLCLDWYWGVGYLCCCVLDLLEVTWCGKLL